MHRLRLASIVQLLMAAFVVLAVWSCKPQVPKQYLQPDELEDVLYDYYMAQAMAAQASWRDTVAYYKNAYYQAVLAKHGITEAEFDSSLAYYYSNTRRLYDIYRSLSERIGNVAMGLGESVGEIAKYSQLSAEGDTANIWQFATSAMLTPMPPYNKLTFSIEADSTFKRGDSFQLIFMADYIYQSGTRDAVMCVAVHYANGNVKTSNSRVSSTGVSRLRIDGRDDSDIKSIDGFIYLGKGNDDSQTLKLMFINHIQFIRFHKRQEESPEALKRDSVATDVKTSDIELKADDGLRPVRPVIQQPQKVLKAMPKEPK